MSSEWVQSEGATSHLRYRPEKQHDYGTLRCYATNAVGRQALPCVYKVLQETGREEKIINFNIFFIVSL